MSFEVSHSHKVAKGLYARIPIPINTFGGFFKKTLKQWHFLTFIEMKGL